MAATPSFSPSGHNFLWLVRPPEKDCHYSRVPDRVKRFSLSPVFKLRFDAVFCPVVLSEMTVASLRGNIVRALLGEVPAHMPKFACREKK
jgi:hypothetical protein